MVTLNKRLFLRIIAFKYAFEGLKNGIQKEVPLQIHTLALTVVIAVGFYFHITQLEWALVFLCSALVISLEMVNTAIECLCNKLSKDISPEIKYIKDLAAAAVLVSVIIALVCAGLIFWKYL